ncbi:MAG: prephenate dehydratase [Methanocellales archaeon]
MIIGILGPEGTFSEKAAKTWRRNAKLKYFDDIPEIFKEVSEGRINFAIVPIENSLEGSVIATLNLLLEFDLKIAGEIVIPIDHCLLSKGKLTNIKVIVSHPQALAQCSKFLRMKFPNVELRAVGSTAHAAKLAMEFEEVAAVASEEAGRKYGLNVLMRDIQNERENYTRFVILARGVPKPGIKNKTSIVVHLKENRPGALYEFLGVFAKRNINLTKIESRPSKKALGDYLFFIDFEGYIKDRVVVEALDEARGMVDWLKILGSYPAAS